MHENLELVEKLVNKTGISYADAKAALEKSNWDMLDAIILLEAEGKIEGGKTAEYSTNKEKSESSENNEAKSAKSQNSTDDFKKKTKGVGEWLRDVFDKGNSNSINMYRNGERKFGMPVTVFVLLLIFGFWGLIPLMIVGLFFGCSYRFSGDDLGKDSVNNAMGKANNIADSIKNEFKNND